MSYIPDTMANPMTTLGDLIKGATAGSPSALPAGNEGSFLKIVGGIPTWVGGIPSTRALFGGGSTGSVTAAITYIDIAVTGNSVSFGNLTSARGDQLAACASSTRGVFAGGTGPSNVIDYVTIASTGNATSFGTLVTAYNAITACSNNTRGVFAGGDGGTTDMTYITIASTGNSTTFGNLIAFAANYYGAGLASTTRGVFAFGYIAGTLSTVEYITIASTGNATSFGDLLEVRQELAGCSNSTRGVFAGGYNNNLSPAYSVTIQYITIASTGNASDFSDLTQGRKGLAAASNSARAVFAGGTTGSLVTTIDYVELDTLANAAAFGDLTAATDGLAGCSAGHGGI